MVCRKHPQIIFFCCRVAEFFCQLLDPHILGHLPEHDLEENSSCGCRSSGLNGGILAELDDPEYFPIESMCVKEVRKELSQVSNLVALVLEHIQEVNFETPRKVLLEDLIDLAEPLG